MLKERLNDNIHYIGGFKKMFRGNVALSKLFTPKQLCRMLIKDDYDLVVSFLEGQCCRILSAYEGKRLLGFMLNIIQKMKSQIHSEALMRQRIVIIHLIK